MKNKILVALTVLMSGWITLPAAVWQPVQSTIPVASAVKVLSSDVYSSTLRFDMEGYFLHEVQTPRGIAYTLSSPGGTPLQQVGAPDLPKFALSLLIPDAGSMEAEVLDARFSMRSGLSLAPSKGNLSRSQNPAEVPYRYGVVYGQDAFWPSVTQVLQTPYILRDYRGQSIWVQPFAYNPQRRELRICTSLTLRVSHLPQVPGPNSISRAAMPQTISGYFAPIYKNHFANFGALNYTPLEDNTGRMLIICHDAWMGLMQPLVEWKTRRGIAVELVSVQAAGSTATGIQAFIQSYYQTHDLTFVLLVGDVAQVPTLTASGGASDPSYGYLAGIDSYAEVMVGRFSAELDDDVSTQVQRVLTYERYPDPAQSWYKEGVVVGSDQGPGDDNEMDWEHASNMRSDLVSFTYANVAELYDGTHPGTGDLPGDPGPTDLFNVFQSGISLMTYTGHGSSTSCGTTGLSNANVQAMTNTNRLPFIWSVACVNGDFTNSSTPCFAEAFLRAQVNGQPTGAIATLMSSINQSWNPPMDAQDEMVDILCQLYPSNLKYTFGGLSVNGCMHMNDNYGSAGDEMTDTWHIFGDPSLLVRTDIPQPMSVNHASSIPVGLNNLNVNCSHNGALVSLTLNGDILATGIVANGNALLTFAPVNQPDTIYVTVTGFNQIPYEGQVLVIPASGPYVIYQQCVVQDPTGNNNGLADYGEAITLDLTLQNVGLADASGVSTVISTSDPYVSLTGTTATPGQINSGSSVTVAGAFSFNVASNVPDQHAAQFSIVVSDNSGNSWTSGFAQVIQAPQLRGGVLSVDDSGTGDGDGYLESGETAQLTIRCHNDGHSDAVAAVAGISTFSNFLTIVNGSFNIGPLAQQGYADATFTVSMASNVTVGTAWDVQLQLVAGQYTAQESYNGTAGIILEDFETNNFNRFNWITGGNMNWFSSTTQPFEGLYCAESGDINDNEVSELSLVIHTFADDSVSFWYRTDSEQSWDFLRFYIDGNLMGEWSGTAMPWTYAAFPVTAGTHTLRFTYEKDTYYSSGADAVWLDNIRFPAGTQTTSLQQFGPAAQGATLWPNPARDLVTVKLPAAPASDAQYQLFDARGRLVAGGRLSGLNNLQFNITLQGLATGMYQLVISSGVDRYGIRVVLEP